MKRKKIYSIPELFEMFQEGWIKGYKQGLIGGDYENGTGTEGN